MSEPFWSALGAPAGAGGVDYEGAWAAGTSYVPGDVVLYNGVNYLAVNPSTGVAPPTGLLLAAFAGAKVYSDSVQSIANTSAALTFNLEEYDSDGFHDNAVNNSRLIVPAGKAGKYSLKAGAFITGLSTQAWIGFRKNGTGPSVRGYRSVATGSAYHQVATDIDLAAGDYVEVLADTTGAGTGQYGHATLPDAQKFFAMHFLGA